MSKNAIDIPDFDFGFTATTSDQIVAPVVQNHTQNLTAKEQEYQERIDNILKAITPLLNNLAKDSDTKEFIHWPNRKAKIEEFRKRLNDISGK
jgi:hypothetical protein